MFVFIDFLSSLNHSVINTQPFGASENQFYNLLSRLPNSICINKIENDIKIDNIEYYTFDKINNLNENDIIIIQRFYPFHLDLKIKNKIYIWIHDYPTIKSTSYFIYPISNEELTNKWNNINVNFIFVSNYVKNEYINFFTNYNIIYNENNMKIIYNSIFEDTLYKQDNIIKTNTIVYASAWCKGIKKIIELYEYVKVKDNTIKLILMSPNYDWNYEEFIKSLDKDIIIYGPTQKEKYCKIIQEAICVIAPPFHETFGCVFAESYYLETAVIASINSGAVFEIIDNLFIIDYDNKELFYNKIIVNKSVKLDDKFLFRETIKLWKNIL